MKLSDFNPLNNAVSITAGEAITKKDAVFMDGVYGKAFKVRNIQAAVVSTLSYGTAQTSTATGRIIAQTSAFANVAGGLNYRNAILTDSDKNIYLLAPNSTNTGCTVYKYNSTCALVGSVDALSGTTTCAGARLLLLANGNLAVVFSRLDTNNLSYAVFDKYLNVITALTVIEAADNHKHDAIALSGGGFAVVYQQTANPLLSRFATYSNTGTVVTAATTIWTRTGTTGAQLHKMVELSNGNIAWSGESNNTVSSIGLYYGVITATGTQVQSPTNLDATAVGTSAWPEISAVTGYFAIALPRTSGVAGAWVFNNAGTLQGAGWSPATAITNTAINSKLVNDGYNFWLTYLDTTNSKRKLLKIPTTGTNYVLSDITTTGTDNFGLNKVDAFCENGFICGFSTGGAANQQGIMWVARTDTGALVSQSATVVGATYTGSPTAYPAVVSFGDGAFVAGYELGGAAISTNFCAGKYINTAIIGVAQTSVAAGALTSVMPGAGAYSVNSIGGVPGAAFDHTASVTVYGNKGTLMTNGIVLKGM